MRMHANAQSAIEVDLGSIQPAEFFAVAMNGRQAFASLLQVQVHELMQLKFAQPTWLTCGIGFDGRPMLETSLLGFFVLWESCSS